MTPPASVFHSLLRPCVIQILRASGYHATKPTVIDFLTELTSKYLFMLCESTAQHASTHSPDASPNIVDILDAFEDCAFIPPRPLPSLENGQDDSQDLDLSGFDDLLTWLNDPKYSEIRRIASDGEDDFTDYLSALKKRHSKTNEEARYQGTLLGKPNNHGDVVVEGWEFPTLQAWISTKLEPAQCDSRPPSSGLSSLAGKSSPELEDIIMS
ncbi:hypothetical protein MKZ38_005660 [Zalerion maritima]|uniref:Bromodomain associated domain-containing protein n=1 Tax=Zalerion maritima TaxID=339359 RepID=A0AAD5S3U9_9PEZI|nr:hypothetical protein MKZ38_005660 [Zalerion maritima]